MKTVSKLWFDDERIFIKTVNEEVLSQPLRFFPQLQAATEEQRKQWSESYFGLHWDKLDEDISFESFTWADDDPLTLYYQHPIMN